MVCGQESFATIIEVLVNIVLLLLAILVEVVLLVLVKLFVVVVVACQL